MFGPGLSGPLKTERCNTGTLCKIEVRAGLGPIDDEAAVAGQRECVIRVPVAKALRNATTTVRWELSTNSIARGFTFRTPGVAVDNAGTIFGPSSIGPGATSVDIPVLPSAFTSALSYTIFLHFKRPTGPLEFDCDGLDPIIVSRD